MTTMTKEIHIATHDVHARETQATIASVSDQEFYVTRTYGMFHNPARLATEACALLFVTPRESSGTMAFDAGVGNTFEVTPNANVSSTNLVNAQAGEWLHFIICQPSSGGPYTFNWPGTVLGGMTIGTMAGKCSAQSFGFDGTSAFATSVGVANQ